MTDRWLPIDDAARQVRVRVETIRVFAVSKLAWIKQHQLKIQTQERVVPVEGFTKGH